MHSKINVRDIPVQNIHCGNIILYLDQLWKVIKIKYSHNQLYIKFHAERQLNESNSSTIKNLNKDILQFQRVLETTVSVVE